MPNYHNKTKDELIKELQKLQQEYDSVKTSYEKEITKCEQVEAALKFTQLILNNAADTMVCIDYDGRYIDFNEAFCRSVGYSREELLSMTVHDTDPNYQAGIWPGFMKKLKQAGFLTFESCHRTKEGKLIPVEIRVSFFEHNGKEYHCGFARDITERKQAEGKLRQSEMKLKTLFDVLPIGVSILDAERNVVFINPALERILNITKDGLIGGDYKSRKYIRPDGTQMPEEEFASVRTIKEQRAVHNVETGVVKEDGNVIWTSVSAVPVEFTDWKVVVVTADITDRKLAEESLSESEERFRRLYQQAPLGYQSLDAEGCFIDVNQAWLDLLRYSHDEVIGRWFGDFLAPQEVDAFKQRFTCFKATGEVHVDLEMVQRTGSKIIVHIDGKTGHDEHGQFKQTHCILSNITERKRTEEALRLEKENFRHSLDDSPLGVRIASIEGNTIYANKTLLDFYGYDSLEELQRTPLKDRYTPESYLQAQERRCKRERGDLSATDYEISIVRKNGEIRHLRVFRKEVLWDDVRQFQVICSDITERKHAEEALHESEERYRRLVEGSPDAIAVHSKGRFVFVNPAGAKLIGAGSPRELIGKPILDVVHPGSRSQVIERLRHVAEGKEAPLFEEKFLKFDGSVIDVEVVGIPFSYQGQTATQVVVRDITERKQAEEETRKSKKLLEDLHKHLNEIRENEREVISREIHDELGQSMTALKLDLNQMHKYMSNNPEAVMKLGSMIKLISNTIKNMQRISSELRPGILDDLGLVSAIEWYCDEFEKRTGITCFLELDNSDYSDSQINLAFFRILQETLTNVIRHARASAVNIRLHQSHKGTTMALHDNGIGIPEEKIESHTSLGLINMRERVRQFGGKINISSEKGQGTKLTIFIPGK